MTPDWSQAAWLAGLAVAAAVLLRGPSPDRRLAALGSRPECLPARGSPRVRTAPLRRLRGLRRTRGPDGPAEVAALVAELAVLLRAGLAPAPAWRQLAGSRQLADSRQVTGSPVAAAAAAAAGAAATGRDVAQALRAVAAEPGTGQDVARGLTGLAAAWQVAQRSGAPTAEVLQRLAEVLRADGDAADARDAALAAPRATARVLVALPVAGLLLGTLVGTDPVGVLLGTPAGRVSAVAGAVCTLSGWWWTRRLLASAQVGAG